ncbi:MAG: norM 1 [Firmicutes bacterium]|nr:norM 1 [Bacillota bacterium]
MQDNSTLLKENDANRNISIKNILIITYPLILSMFSLNIMMFIDRAFVARYDLTQFAALVPASNLAVTTASIFTGMLGFVGTLVAQYYGAKKYAKCSVSMWQGVYLSGAFSILLLLVSPLAVHTFSLMGHTGDLLNYEQLFFYFMMVASCAQLFSVVFSSFFRGISATRVTLYVGLLGNVINVLLDWGLIFGHWGMPQLGGITGSGLATVISCFVSALIYVLLFMNRRLKDEYKIFQNMKIDGALLRQLLVLGLPSGMQYFVGMGSFSMLLLIIGKTGEFNLTCANIAFTIEGMSLFSIIGLATAIGIISGQERGAKRIDNISRVLYRGLLLGLGVSSFFMILFNIIPERLVAIFEGSDGEKFKDVVAYTVPLLRITTIWLTLDSIQIVIGRVLQNVGDTVFLMYTFIIVPVLFFVLLPYLICVVWQMSLYWLWLELVGYSLAMVIVMAVRFSGGKWKKIEVI